MPDPRSARPLARRIAVGVAAAVGVLVALVVVLVLLVDSDVATKRAADLVLPRISRALGREVGLRDASLKLFPNPRVKLAGLTVAGRPGEPALVDAESLDVEVGLWPLLRSLGKTVDVHAVTLVRPTVNLVRAKDGTWSHEGLGAGGGAKAPPPEAPAGDGAAANVAIRRVRVEKAAIRVIDRAAGDEAGVALKDLDLDATGLGPGLPLDARLAAALADDRQNVHAQLSVARLPAGVPERPEDWPEVHGALQVGALALERFRALLPAELGSIVRGGVATLDAKVSTGERRTYRVDGRGELRDLRLRGQAASGRFRAVAAWSPARPDGARVDLTELSVKGPGIELGGHASVQTPPLRATFLVTGPLLDLDAVMGLLPEDGAKAAPEKASGDLVPASMRREIQAASARGTVAIGEVRSGRLILTDVKGRATLAKGTLTLDELDAATFGGRVSAAGTRVALSEKEPSWKLAARLSAVDLGAAMQAFTGAAPLVGKLDGKLEVAGTGTAWEKLRDGLTGLAALAVKDGALTTTDVGDEVLGAVALGLEKAGRGGAAKDVASRAGGKTTFRDLAGDFSVKDGFLAARAPVKLDAPFGAVALGGRVGLDGRLDLTGTTAVPRSALAGVAGRVPLPDTLEVPLGLGGTLTRPAVSVRADDALAGALRGSTQAAVKGAKKEAERAGRKAIGDVLKGFGRKR